MGTRIVLSDVARLVLLVSLPFMVLSGCKKPDEDLGLDLLPGDPLGLVVDSLELRAYTVKDSAVRTSALSRNLVGSYLDAEFGLVKAGVVTQIRLSANNIGSGQNNNELVPDSLVLSMAFDGMNYVYGNLNPQVFEVYELAEDFFVDSAYKSDRLPQTLGEDLNLLRGGRITPQPLRKPFIDGDSLVPQLRIPLSQDLAQRFIDAFGSADMVDNEAFLQFFKGLYVTVNNGTQLPFEAGVLYFNLLSGASKVTLYYRNEVTAPTEQRTLDFLINQNCVRYTTMVHEREQAYTPDLMNALADTSTNATATYVQALGGLRTIIRVPDLLDFAGEGRVLSKAELIVPVKGNYYPAHLPPSQLFIFRKDENDKDVFLPDQLNGIGAIDGAFRSDERAYRFNITRYVQQVLNGTLPNSKLALVSSSNGVSANRVVLAGPEDGAAPMKLRLTFTTY